MIFATNKYVDYSSLTQPVSSTCNLSHILKMTIMNSKAVPDGIQKAYILCITYPA